MNIPLFMNVEKNRNGGGMSQFYCTVSYFVYLLKIIIRQLMRNE